MTGGGRGLGRSIALGLAEAGADLFVASRKQANCESVAGDIRALGRRAVAVEADLGSPDSIEALADRVLGEAGRLHVLVNNAAIVWAAPTLEYPMAAWDKVFNVNVRGLWQLSQRVARHMAERGGGSIIHVSSDNAYQGDFEERQNIIAYNASKGAVRSLTKDMAVKLAPHGIRVNAISPGAFHTAMIDPIEAQPKLHAALVGRIPMGRIGDSDEIKGAAVFLASDAASYVTGATLVVDGGMLSL